MGWKNQGQFGLYRWMGVMDGHHIPWMICLRNNWESMEKFKALVWYSMGA